MVSLSAIAPHFASEMLESLLNKDLSKLEWPQYDPDLAEEVTVDFVVQVNGKLRGTFKA